LQYFSDFGECLLPVITEQLSFPVSIHRYKGLTIKISNCRAIAEAVPIPAARAWQVGFVVDKMALEQVFSEYFGFPC
jgi:hypothetical protein